MNHEEEEEETTNWMCKSTDTSPCGYQVNTNMFLVTNKCKWLTYQLKIQVATCISLVKTQKYIMEQQIAKGGRRRWGNFQLKTQNMSTKRTRKIIQTSFTIAHKSRIPLPVEKNWPMMLQNISHRIFQEISHLIFQTK